MNQEIKEIIIPPCGHIDCHDFMGCIIEFRMKMGIIDSNIRFGIPGQKIKLRKIGDRGFSYLDWEIIADVLQK